MGIAFNVDEITGAPKPRSKKRHMMDGCIELLKEMLEENGYARLSDIKAEARERGLSERTLSRAKAELKLKSLTMGFSEKITWWMYQQIDKDTVRDRQNNEEKLSSI